jgi:hypothetical protein
MTQWTFFELGGAREFHECETNQQEALAILRRRPLTKVSFELDRQGARLAPAINILRKGWGFEIDGDGSRKHPYRLLDKNQSPSMVHTTEGIKNAYYATEHWVKIREQRFEHDHHRCVICVGPCHDENFCHHIKYNLFNESLDELMTVCESHHLMIHDNCLLKFPTGVSLPIAERLLNVVAYPFEDWLLS